MMLIIIISLALSLMCVCVYVLRGKERTWRWEKGMLCSSGSIVGEGERGEGGGVFFFVPFSVGCLETWKEANASIKFEALQGLQVPSPMINMDNVRYMRARNINKYLECSRKLRATT